MSTAQTTPLGLTLACMSFATLSACGNDINPSTPVDVPLVGGDAEWPEAPIPQPGGNGAPKQTDVIKAKVSYLDPETLEPHSDEVSIPLQTLVTSSAAQLYKGDVIVNYAKAFIAIKAMLDLQDFTQAIETATAMVGWLELAASKLGDPEISEMAEVMDDYRAVLEAQYG